jgi:putative endonuclease
MLRCEDNSIYTGITVDVERRMNEHSGRNSKCAKYTMTHKVKKLEAVWESENRITASKLEYHIKRLSKKQKEELIKNNNIYRLLGDKIDSKKYNRVK